MKKILALLFMLLSLTTFSHAEELKKGVSASDWSFNDADDKAFSMQSWAGMVLVINYVDPDEAELNEPFTDALTKAKKAGVLDGAKYIAIGIADCAATWKPNFAIKAIAGKKAKKYKTTILFDYKATLREAWTLKKDTSNIIILDKNRVCQAIIRGKIRDDQISSMVKLVAKLQDI